MTSDIANDGPPVEAFGLRLTIAAIWRFSTIGSFNTELKEHKTLSRGSVYRHAAGERFPGPEIISIYESILRIPSGWLVHGAGESIEELQEAESAIKARQRNNPVLLKVLAHLESGDSDIHGKVVPINQASREFSGTHGNFIQIRHIPILAARDIMEFKAGRLTIDEISMLPAKSIPVIHDDELGPRCFGYKVGTHDLSMTATGGPSFPPGTQCIIDPDREILPGDYILVRHLEEDEYVVRRFKAARRYGLAQEFSLEALNPSFEPIRVTDVTQYEVAGRLVKTVSNW